MALTYSLLGQKRENSTNAVFVYSPAASTETIIRSVIIANTTASTVKVRMFLDDNGSTYDETTSLAWDVEIPGNSVWDREVTLCMNDATGNFAYRSSVANALTISVFGREKTT